MGATRKKTWTIHRYIEAPNEPSVVLAWLRAAAVEAEEIPVPRGVAFHFGNSANWSSWTLTASTCIVRHL